MILNIITIMMIALTNFLLNTITLRFLSIYNICACSSSQNCGPSTNSLPRNSHRNKNASLNTYPLAMQPFGHAFSRTYIFKVFMYLSKKNIHLIETTPAISMSSTRCISKCTCMKLVGKSFSNTHTISTISFFHFGTSHTWIYLVFNHLINDKKLL